MDVVVTALPLRGDSIDVFGPVCFVASNDSRISTMAAAARPSALLHGQEPSALAAAEEMRQQQEHTKVRVGSWRALMLEDVRDEYAFYEPTQFIGQENELVMRNKSFFPTVSFEITAPIVNIPK